MLSLIHISTPAPIGTAQAVRELGLQDKVTVVGTCVEEDCQDVLSDGSLDCGMLWNTQNLGYLTVACAKALLDGNTLSNGATIDVYKRQGWNLVMPWEDSGGSILCGTGGCQALFL